MSKLLTVIIIISLTLFISCDDKKAKDEIKKALDKTVEVDKKPAKTPKPVLVANKVALQAEIAKAIKEHGDNSNLNYIDTSQVTDFSGLFRNNTTFNGDVSKWNTSKVTDMRDVFYGATAFNQNLNSWDVSSVTNMSAMFKGAASFNQPLNNWDVSNVEGMGDMFEGATSFNQDISGWADKSGRYTVWMFKDANAMQASNKPHWATAR